MGFVFRPRSISHNITSMLLAAQSAQSSSSDIMFWVLILVALLLVLAMGTLWLRRWMKQEDEALPTRLGFTLRELDDLRRDGKLTDAEYAKLRAEVLAQTRASLESPPRRPPGE